MRNVECGMIGDSSPKRFPDRALVKYGNMLARGMLNYPFWES